MSVATSETILEEDRRLVHHVGKIYLNREDPDVVDVNLERIATYAQQLDDPYRGRELIFVSPSHEFSVGDNRRANICRELAIKYRPRNLQLFLNVESFDQTIHLNQNYGDSHVLVYKDTREPLVLDDMDVRQHFDYVFEGKLLLPVLSVINLLRRCRGPVTFVHSGRTPSFDQPIATIVPPLKILLSFLWQEASSSDRGRFDMTFTIGLDSEQKQQLHRHCIDISPGETQSGDGFSSAKLPGPDENTDIYIHMETKPVRYDFPILRVYTRRLVTGGGVPTPLEPRWTPRLTFTF